MKTIIRTTLAFFAFSLVLLENTGTGQGFSQNHTSSVSASLMYKFSKLGNSNLLANSSDSRNIRFDRPISKG